MSKIDFRFYQYNGGASTPTTNPTAASGVASSVGTQTTRTSELQAKTNEIKGTDNKQTSNSQGGYQNNQQYGPPAPTPNVQTDFNRMIAKDKPHKFFDVGGTVNAINPQSGKGPAEKYKGTPSLFNNYWLVHYSAVTPRISNENPVVNNLGAKDGVYVGMAANQLYKNPSTTTLVNVFDGSNKGGYFSYPEKKYTYSDFLYLKNYHPFNNNRLITLRRFLVPVTDACRTNILSNTNKPEEYRTPIAKALTYLGASDNKLSALTNFTVEINSETKTGNLSDKPVKISQTEFADIGKFLGNGNSNNTNDSTFGYAFLTALSGVTDANDDVFKKWQSAMNPWQNGAYEDLVYGPVNVITGARIRSRGLKYNHNIQLNFEYSTKAIERINPKAAMLDIVSNMLGMTYQHANFYGGSNRYQIEDTNFPFLGNTKVFDFIKKLGKEGSEAALKNYANDLKDIGSGLTGRIGDLIAELKQGKTDGPTLDALKKNATNIASQLNNTAKDQYKAINEGTKSTLNGSPTGEWHLQVGNPFAPIMMIGNLWCTTSTFTFNDDLSADDFPTELKVSIKLEYGRQRDASDIQSMFNEGLGRIYYPYANKADVNASSAFYNTTYAYNIKPSDDKEFYNIVTNEEIGGITYNPQQKIEAKTSTVTSTVEAMQGKNQNELNKK